MACGPPRPSGRGSWKVKTRGCGGLWPTCRSPSRSCGSGRGKLVSPTRRLGAVTQAMGRSCIRPRPTCRNSRLSPPGSGWRGEPASGWPLRLPAVARRDTTRQSSWRPGWPGAFPGRQCLSTLTEGLSDCPQVSRAPGRGQGPSGFASPAWLGRAGTRRPFTRPGSPREGIATPKQGLQQQPAITGHTGRENPSTPRKPKPPVEGWHQTNNPASAPTAPLAYRPPPPQTATPPPPSL